MKNKFLNRFKNILREVWGDFKNSPHSHPSHSSCCGFEPSFNEFPLQQEPIRVNKTDNFIKNLKK